MSHTALTLQNLQKVGIIMPLLWSTIANLTLDWADLLQAMIIRNKNCMVIYVWLLLGGNTKYNLSTFPFLNLCY